MAACARPVRQLTHTAAMRRLHAGVHELRSRTHWLARPNFHLGSFQRGFCWTCNQRDLDSYVQLWGLQ